MNNKVKVVKDLGMNRSSFYYRHKIPVKDEELREEIEKVMISNPGYGYRRVAIALKINHKRALRVMNKYGLKPARRAKAPSKESAPASNYPNIINRLCPIALNVVWVADFTYISFKGEFIYLATVIDIFSKEVIGFAVKTNHDTNLILEAFDMAVITTNAKPDWFHNDNGSEYRSLKFEILLKSLNIGISISPKPWYNGSQESFFGRFKIEFGDFDRFDPLPELVEHIALHINYYNNFRIHLKLKMAPVDFKNNWLSRQVLAPPRGANTWRMQCQL